MYHIMKAYHINDGKSANLNDVIEEVGTCEATILYVTDYNGKKAKYISGYGTGYEELGNTIEMSGDQSGRYMGAANVKGILTLKDGEIVSNSIENKMTKKMPLYVMK